MLAKDVRPIRNLCLIQADDREETIAGGLLYLPVSETTPEKLSQGTGVLVRLGPGEKVKKLGIQVGERVAYRGYLKHANPIESDDETKKFLMLSVDDIIGVIPAGLSVGVFSSPASHSRPAEAVKDSK